MSAAATACCMTDAILEPGARRIGLFGGSFNPPHVCHTLTTVWALQTHGLDEVWWIPTFQHAFDKALADFGHRWEMCERATADIARVRISDIERRMGGESRTIDTVEALADEHPEASFSLIIGADILAETSRWKNWQGLVELVDLIVIGRMGHDEEVAPRSTEFALPDISSTRIRRELADRDFSSLRFWLDHAVVDYIVDHDLYLSAEVADPPPDA